MVFTDGNLYALLGKCPAQVRRLDHSRKFLGTKHLERLAESRCQKWGFFQQFVVGWCLLILVIAAVGITIVGVAALLFHKWRLCEVEEVDLQTEPAFGSDAEILKDKPDTMFPILVIQQIGTGGGIPNKIPGNSCLSVIPDVSKLSRITMAAVYYDTGVLG